MLKKYSLKTIQMALNKGLSLDEQASQKIKALDGKALKLVINPIQIHFFIFFSDGELHLLDQYDKEVDTIIHSNPIGFLRLGLLPSTELRSLFNNEVNITGDVELGQQVKQLFEELDIDWEGQLAQFTGDVPAYQIGSLIRKGLAFQKQVTNSMCLNVNEYVHEELRLLPSKMELDDFFHDVDELSLDVERLQAQVNHFLSEKP